MVEDVKQSIFTEDSIDSNIWECVDVLMFDFGLFDFIVDKFAHCLCKNTTFSRRLRSVGYYKDPLQNVYKT